MMEMENRNKVAMIILSYTHKVRNQIRRICYDFFSGTWAEEHVSTIYTCIDELIKNAFKANYKFFLVIDEIKKRLRAQNPLESDAGINRRVEALIRNKMEFDKACEEIFSEVQLGEKVRKILDEESHHLDLKNLAYEEQRSHTAEEMATLEDLTLLNDIRKLLKERDVNVKFTVESDEDSTYIEVTNTAPIMTKDRERIYEKRNEYYQYFLKGKEHEFFINNIDTSDAGFGLGYALIDSFLKSMDVDLRTAMAIISEENTIIMIILPNRAPQEKVNYT